MECSSFGAPPCSHALFPTGGRKIPVRHNGKFTTSNSLLLLSLDAKLRLKMTARYVGADNHLAKVYGCCEFCETRFHWEVIDCDKSYP